MKKILLPVCLCLLTGLPILRAQETEEREPQGDMDLYESPFQFTFLTPPLSTNGFRNSRTVNHFSLNLLIGNSGATDGFELGSLINTDNYYLKGFQGSGFLNIVGGPVDGMQLAGFGNTAGITKGAQLSGFFNVARVYDGGIQLGGFTNVSGEGSLHTQIAGFCNVAGSVDAVQASGFINVARNVRGVQGAGFINVAEYVQGVQVAGFINICDSIDGVPIGVISVVRHNGYRHFVIGMSESQYISFAFRMGVRRLYTILGIGKASGPGSRWLYGYGLGTEFDAGSNLQLNIEAITHQELFIADNRATWPLQHDRLNMLNQARVLFNFRPNEKICLFAGPTLNVSVSETSPDIGRLPYYEIGPKWAIINSTASNAVRTNVRIWLGVTGGIRL